jgi:hypothetical protein
VNNRRLQHDAAVAIAKACLDVVASCIHPSCHKDAWDEFYLIAKSGIEAYEIQADRMLHRLRPSRN